MGREVGRVPSVLGITILALPGRGSRAPACVPPVRESKRCCSSCEVEALRAPAES